MLSSQVNYNEHKIAQRVQFSLVAPLAVVLLAGVIFVRQEDGVRVALNFAAVMIVALFVAAWLGRVISRKFLQRLNQLRRGAELIEAGQFGPLPIDDKTDDEFDDLARAFNHMVEVIASRETAQREQNLALAELNRRMETVLNATNDGIALLDREGRFALVNRRFCEMLGTRHEALLYHAASDVQLLLTARLANPERLMARLATASEQDGGPSAGLGEEVIEILGAERRFIQVYTAPVRDDRAEVAGRIVALHDITRETEVDKMKTEFISVVSHELRTPLTSIKGYTDLLLTEQAGDINELQREFLGILQGSATRLNNLINDILDISRLESGRIDVKMERVDYEKIVSDVLRLMKASADEKELSFDGGFPPEWPPVRGDADKIMQVLSNLVSNAIKYTPRGGWVKISMEVSGAAIITCVSDSGIGISTEDQKRLFQKFFRADNSTTREAGGTGLGLAIVKTMIELLGGSIWMESEPGKGSRFYFTLPLYNAQAPAQADASAIPAQKPRRAVSDGADIAPEEIEAALVNSQEEEPRPERIPAQLVDRGLGLVLLVDDDVYVREQLQHALHRMGYGVIVADAPDEVQQRARVHKPDVILLDMMISKPEMAGFSIQRSLQDDRATAKLPIVAYSLVGDPVAGSLALGAVSFVRKPVQADMLVKSLREHFGAGSGLSLLLVKLKAADYAADVTQLTEVKSLREQMDREGVRLSIAQTAEAAIGLAVSERPNVILLDEETAGGSGGGMPPMFELLRALKSEEDMSRIPLVLLTRGTAEGVRHFHLGTQGGAEMSMALDYLTEQIAQVMRERGVGRTVTRQGLTGPLRRRAAA